MATVAIVGAGDIGGACAQALAARDRVGHILVIDAAANAAAGKALDIQQSGAISGYLLERVVSQVQLRRIEARVSRLWPPGPYALGAAAACVTEALLQSSRRSYSVLTVLDGEFGVRDRVGAVPALLASHGVAHT